MFKVGIISGVSTFLLILPSPNFVISARDSRLNYIKGYLLECEQKQNALEALSFKKVKKKLKKVLARGYISLNDEVKWLTYFFPVQKTWKVDNSKCVSDDIRMVYDTTRYGPNKTV